MEAKFKFYNTEQHGYLQTSLSYLRKLKISKLISPYSRRLDNKVFLEEDCDLRLFSKRHEAKGISILIEEDFSKPQLYFDNLPNYRDNECQDEQFDGFKSNWEIKQYLAFSKPDSIKHLNNNHFETKDGKTVKVVQSFYIDGKLATEKQLEKLGITVEYSRTTEVGEE